MLLRPRQLLFVLDFVAHILLPLPLPHAKPVRWLRLALFIRVACIKVFNVSDSCSGFDSGFGGRG